MDGDDGDMTTNKTTNKLMFPSPPGSNISEKTAKILVRRMKIEKVALLRSEFYDR